MHLHFVADLRHVIAKTELGAFERRRRLEPDRGQAVSRIDADLVQDYVERDRTRYAVHVEFAAHFELIRTCALLDLGALERRDWELGCVEEARRTQIVIEIGQAAVQVRQRNRDADCSRQRMCRVEFERALDAAELRGWVGEAEMVPTQHALRVVCFKNIRRGVQRSGSKQQRGSEGNAKHRCETPVEESGGVTMPICTAEVPKTP